MTYVVAANPTHDDRSGIIQIADQIFGVNQSGIYTSPSNCFYTVSPNGIGPGSYTPFTDTVFVEAQSSCQWNVLNTNAWITITSSLTNSGSGQVTFSVSQNPSTDARSGNISVAGQLVSISQSGAPNTLTLAEALDTIGTPLVWTSGEVSGNWQWFGQTPVTHDGVDAARSAPITQAGASSILKTTVNGPGAITFWWKTSAKPPYDGLHFFIDGSQQAFIGGDIDWQQQTFPLTSGSHQLQWMYWKDGGSSGDPGQDCGWVDQVQFVPSTNSCNIALSPANRTHSAGAASNIVTVLTGSGCAWTVLATNPWISIVSGTNGTGPGTVTYTVASNSASSVRSGNINVGSAHFLVTQTGVSTGCTYSISTPSYAQGYGAATNSVAVTAGAGCAWSVSNTNSWINLLSGTSGTGNGTVLYSVPENPSTNARSGNVQIAGLNYALTQGGAPVGGCTYVLSPVGRTHGSTASTGVVTITTSAGCAWQVLNTNGWVTMVGPIDGAGGGQVLYSVEANPNAHSRVGTLSIGGHLFFIIQTGAVASCSYVISPVNAAHGSGSSTGSVSVTTQNGCPWSVVNTNPWISILSSLNNSSSGTVVYSLAPNTNSQARTGNIIIGGQHFLLTQAGASLSGTNAPWLQFMSRTETGATLAVQGAGGKMYVVECSEDSIHWIPIKTCVAVLRNKSRAAHWSPLVHCTMKTATIPLVGFDRQIGAIGAVVAKHAVAQMIAEAVIDLGRSGLFFPQFLHGGMRQVAFAVQFAVVGQHEAIAENVVRGGEQAAPGFGKTVNAIAERLRQETDAAPGVTVLLLVRTVGAGQPGNLRFTGPERGFGHAQRIEEPLLQKLLVRHAADDLDDARGDVHALIAIVVFVAGLPLQRTGHRAERAGFQRRAVRAGDLLQLGRCR